MPPPSPSHHRPLSGRVALVTGASRGAGRGAGRGIAIELAAAGATVYITGRSRRGQLTNSLLPGTSINETAEQASARGGRGIAIPCDHRDDEQVASLCKTIAVAQDRLDILVNNVWGGYERDNAGWEQFDAPFWEQRPTSWDSMFAAGLRAHFTASHFAAPLLLKSAAPLIVNITFYDRGKALSNLPYDLAKRGIQRLAYLLSLELREKNGVALALSPGFMRTEDVLRHTTPALTPESVVDFSAHPELERSESVYYIGARSWPWLVTRDAGAGMDRRSPSASWRAHMASAISTAASRHPSNCLPPRCGIKCNAAGYPAAPRRVGASCAV